MAASSALTKQTNAATFTTSAAVKNKVVVLQIDPGLLTDGYEFIAVTTGASNAANITSAMLIVEPRYGNVAQDYTA